MDERRLLPGDSAIEISQQAGPTLATGLESCGLAVADTALLLDRLAGGASIAHVSRDIAHGRLLRKRSASGRRHIVAAVRRRFIEESGRLPGIGPVSAALHRFTMSVARSQVLLPYLFTSDVAALALSTALVLPRLQRGVIPESLCCWIAGFFGSGKSHFLKLRPTGPSRRLDPDATPGH